MTFTYFEVGRELSDMVGIGGNRAPSEVANEGSRRYAARGYVETSLTVGRSWRFSRSGVSSIVLTMTLTRKEGGMTIVTTPSSG